MTSSQTLRRIGMTLLTAFAFSGALAQVSLRDVPRIEPPQPVENDGKVEVFEFFAYGCIHCAHLEPKLAEWIAKQPADVKVKRVPAAFAVRGVDSIPIFYTLEAMGVVEKLHQKLFDAINVENAMLGNAATLNKWLEKQGIDTKKYEEMQKSFSVQNRINRARHMSQDYKITGTPTLVVNGRYSFEQGQGTPERMFAMIDIAIAETRTSLFKSAAAPVPAAVKQK